MRAIPTRPVTIDSTRYGERWFPLLFRHTDGTLLMYVEYGHDAHFAPFFRIESRDEGRTWSNPCDNVPRCTWALGFADNELLEMDAYGVQDPKKTEYACHYGAWSDPAKPNSPVKRELIRVHCPSTRAAPLASLPGYPTVHWWDLWNGLHGTSNLKGPEIFLNGPNMTSGFDAGGGRLIATGYGASKDESIKGDWVWLYESRDRGHNWREISVVARPSDSLPRGANEATIVRLRDGRLYAVARTFGPRLTHMWSSDEGKTWTTPAPLNLIDSKEIPGTVWPVCTVMKDGTLALVYGRPGKHLVLDPSGTGTQWQSHLDLHAWELDTQATMGVPPEKRLRGIVGHDPNVYCNRYTDSGDYLAVVTSGERGLIVMYDVHQYVESWNAKPVEAVRMVRLEVSG
ncbi:MAG: glycoside hydrolase [Planctomycetes bacterium]|nr:glycoside hydrolase [Planctomycetota bacterium]